MRTWVYLVVGVVAGLVGARPAAAQPVRVALTGTAAPNGDTYTTFTVAPTLNASGQVAFLASLSGAATAGVFAGAPGSLQTVAAQGGTAPGGGTYSTFFATGAPLATPPARSSTTSGR